MDSGLIKIERFDTYALLTLNRPQELNAISMELLDDLDRALDEIHSEQHITTIVLTGAGEKAFCAGADIRSMADLDPAGAGRFSETGQRITRKLEAMPCLTVAAINGYVFGGGCELVLACDMRVATPKSRFSLPEVSLGVIPGFGGTQRLPRLIGRGLAMEMLLAGRGIDAERAWRIGLVNQVVEPEELMDYCKGLAEAVAKNSPGATALCKQAVNMGSEMQLDQALAYEAGLFALSFAHPDQAEGMRAFLEKRAPRYRPLEV